MKLGAYQTSYFRPHSYYNNIHKTDVFSRLQFLYSITFIMIQLTKKITFLFCIGVLFLSCSNIKSQSATLDINAYLAAADGEHIYPTPQQMEMLKKVIPNKTFQPAPSASDRSYWDRIANTEQGKEYIQEAISFLDRKPEVPISDEIYRRANKEGNRGIYKPRYYRTMDRLEKFTLAECMENTGRFIPQIEEYVDSILAMKSWMHPNHDDNENSVMEGKRVSIDLGARKFGLVLSLADVLLENKLSEDTRKNIAEHLKWRITDSYLNSCQKKADVSNKWIRATSNWNSVCTSGSLFTTIVSSDNNDKRIAAIGCALNSMVFYLSGFGDDGYCSEGTGYWEYGFGHYLYLAEMLYDYTNKKINLYEFNDPDKLNNVANFPHNFQIHKGMYSPFSDGVTRVKPGQTNFAYYMAAKYYGSSKPTKFVSDESVQDILAWNDPEFFAPSEEEIKELPNYTYFDDMGIVISRGQQEVPFSIAMKAGHNAENHNHMDVGSYVLVLGEDYISGDIGAPSYIAGAFSDKNPARSSWGHPVPRIDNILQSKGIEFKGTVKQAEFSKEMDNVTIDLIKAYELPSLKKLERNMVNDKSGRGTVTITDTFEADQPVIFGTAVMVNVDYDVIDDNIVMIYSENQKVKVEILSEGGKVKIKDEVVPVKHLRSGKTSYRIGIDFIKPVNKGSITVKYTPVE